MIRHKATGTELKWRPTIDNWGDDGSGWALSSADNSVLVVYLYPSSSGGSCIYPTNRHDASLYVPTGPETKESMLMMAAALGVVEVTEEDPPKDYDAIHRVDEIDQAVDDHNRLLEDARALAIRLFLAGHDDAASALRRLL